MSDLSTLASLAWQVNELLLDERARGRFLDQCRHYLQLSTDAPDRPRPLLIDTDDEYDIRTEDKPPLLLCERYAILAALHTVHCHQEAPVDPAPWPKGAILLLHSSCRSPVYRNNLTWAALVANAKCLDERR